MCNLLHLYDLKMRLTFWNKHATLWKRPALIHRATCCAPFQFKNTFRATCLCKCSENATYKINFKCAMTCDLHFDLKMCSANDSTIYILYECMFLNSILCKCSENCATVNLTTKWCAAWFTFVMTCDCSIFKNMRPVPLPAFHLKNDQVKDLLLHLFKQ